MSVQLSALHVAALTNLFNSGSNPFYMNAAEGTELASAGFIGVNVDEKSPTDPNAYRVSLLAPGAEYLASLGAPVAPPAFPGMMAPPAFAPAPMAPFAAPVPQVQATSEKPKFEIRTDIPVPTIKRGGANNLVPRTSSFPFEQLEIGQSFHVAPTADNPTPHKSMASNVSAANKRSEVDYIDPTTGQPVPEQVTKKTMIKDAEGKAVLGPDGKKTYTVSTVVENRKVATKKFIARQVEASDPQGPGVRVFRVNL